MAVAVSIENAPAPTRSTPDDGVEPRQLVYICSEYPGVVERFGGIGVSVREEARWFAASGRKVTVICQTAETAPGRYRDEGVFVTILPTHRAPKLRAFADRLGVANEARAVLGERPGVVVCPDYSGPIWLKRFRQPLIVQLHGASAVNAAQCGRPLSAKDSWFERRTLRAADLIQAYSEFSAGTTARLFGVHDTPTWVIPHPIDPQRFYPDPAAVHANEILYVGKLNTLKGALVLADALPAVFEAEPDVQVSVVGGDHQEAGQSVAHEFMARIPSRYHDRVRMTGQLSRLEVAERVRRAGILVLPSHVESFGLAVLEAMACGRPVVASARAAIPEVVVDGVTGLLADPDAPATFAKAILTLLQNPNRASRMGEAGRQVVLEKYTPERVYTRVEAFQAFALQVSSQHA